MNRHQILAAVTLLIAISLAVFLPLPLWLLGMSLIFIAWFIYLLIVVPRLSAQIRGWGALTACFMLITVLTSFAIMYYLRADPIRIRTGKSISFIPFIEFKEYSVSIDAQLASILIAPLIALIITLIFFALIGFFSSIYVLALHQEDLTFWEAFRSFVSLVLNEQYNWLRVEDGQVIEVKEKGYKSSWLSLGKIMIRTGNAIVLQKGGTITRIAGPGTVVPEPGEQIRQAFDLRSQSVVRHLKNVITADRIPLEIELSVGYKITPAANSDLPSVIKEKNFGLFPVEEVTLRKAAFNGTAGGWKGFGDNVCIGQLRDQIMAHCFEEIFVIQSDNQDISIRVNDRQVRRIEQAIMDAVNNFADATMGMTITSVDIREITLPERIREKITTEITTLVEERIKQTQAKYIVTEARARAQARILKGQGEGEAQAAFFREVLRELKSEDALDDADLVSNVIKQLMSTMVTVEDLRAYFQSTAFIEQSSSRRLRDQVGETNGHGHNTLEQLED